jgi:hypothetical protein
VIPCHPESLDKYFGADDGVTAYGAILPQALQTPVKLLKIAESLS